MGKNVNKLHVGVVGPCGAGKSTIVKLLKEKGYNIRAIGQEHSYVANMWQKVAPTDILIYLDASLNVIAKRRNIYWGQSRLDALNYRLRHAKAHADLYVDTNNLGINEVVRQVTLFLDNYFL